MIFYESRIQLCILMLGLMVLSLGCGPSRPSVAELTDTNIEKLRAAYGIFANLNGYKGPKDEKALRDFFKNHHRGRVLLERCGADPDNLDEIFVSKRDGEPFVLRYGLRGQADHAIVFEQVGVDGMRQIALSRVIEVDAAKYDDYFSGKIKPLSLADIRKQVDKMGEQ